MPENKDFEKKKLELQKKLMAVALTTQHLKDEEKIEKYIC